MHALYNIYVNQFVYSQMGICYSIYNRKLTDNHIFQVVDNEENQCLLWFYNPDPALFSIIHSSTLLLIVPNHCEWLRQYGKVTYAIYLYVVGMNKTV